MPPPPPSHPSNHSTINTVHRRFLGLQPGAGVACRFYISPIRRFAGVAGLWSNQLSKNECRLWEVWVPSICQLCLHLSFFAIVIMFCLMKLLLVLATHVPKSNTWCHVWQDSMSTYSYSYGFTDIQHLEPQKDIVFNAFV